MPVHANHQQFIINISDLREWIKKYTNFQAFSKAVFQSGQKRIFIALFDSVNKREKEKTISLVYKSNTLV